STGPPPVFEGPVSDRPAALLETRSEHAVRRTLDDRSAAYELSRVSRARLEAGGGLAWELQSGIGGARDRPEALRAEGGPVGGGARGGGGGRRPGAHRGPPRDVADARGDGRPRGGHARRAPVLRARVAARPESQPLAHRPVMLAAPGYASSPLVLTGRDAAVQ